MSTISDKQLEFVSECKTAFEMISKFDKMYLTKYTALQIICHGLSFLLINVFTAKYKMS